MDTMFDTLLQLPLFQGLSQDDFTSILEKVKLDFTKYKSGEVIVRTDTDCDGLLFILKGKIKAFTVASALPVTVIECIQAPYLIEPYSLFGMNVRHVSSYVAETEVHVVRISKSYVLSVLFDYEIFRLNYLNILSNRVQILTQKLWNIGIVDLEKRIPIFFLNCFERLTGEKVVKIKMQDLASLMNETRSNVSKALNTLQEKELLILHRGEVVISDAADLSHFCNQSD